MSSLSVAVVATPGVSPFHFSIPFMIFAQAVEPGLFSVSVCADAPGQVRSDMGFTINVPHGLEPLRTADIIVIPYWSHPEEKPDERLLAELRDAWARGAEVVGLCLGAYVLAYAGLLDNRRAATHWEF